MARHDPSPRLVTHRPEDPLTTVVLAHLLGGVVASLLGRRLGERVCYVAALAPAAALLWLLARAPGVLDGDPVTESWTWIDELGLTVSWRLDAFSLLLGVLVSGIGVLVLLYSRSYLHGGAGPVAGQLTVFAGAMLGLVLADDLLLLYVCWELTTVTSYLLVGTDDRDAKARTAARQALLVTASGGLAMLAGLVLLGQEAGTYRFSEVLADPPTGTVAAVAVVLVLLGALTKSAQIPFHFWLPGAMAAPTPVSAYLHSATMVKAGIYLVARMAPAFAATGPWRPVVLTLGVLTMLWGGVRALRQHDLKLLLAFGTVSQLGFLMVLLGAGNPDMTRAGTALLAAHALFKATLFLVVGAVDHATGTRDLRRLDGLGRRMPLLAAVAALAAASMAGIPPLLGFVAKEYGFESLVDHVEDGWALPVLVGLVAGSVLTVAYTARFLWGAFASKSARRLRDPVDLGAAHAPGALLLGPPLLLAVLSLAAGIVPGVSTRPLVDAALALDRAVDDHTLELWHGITVPLLLSVLAVGLGALLFAGAERIEAVVARLPLLPNAGQAFNALIDRVVRGAGRLTGVVQNGSLPVYLGVILLTAVVLPTAAVLPDAALPEDLVVAESALQLAAAAAVVVVSVATVLSRQRFHAVLGLGATGYAVAVLFMVQGAPDLALTQLLIETLSVVLFVLVLRHLPRRFAVISWRGAQTLRLVVAVTVGATVAVGTLVMAAARRSPSVSEGFLERALPEGGGRNVVNVILVDFRGYDTLGEITVLTVAALGIVALVRAGRGARGSGGGER